MQAARLTPDRRVAAAVAERQTRSRASLGSTVAVRAAFIWPALLAILFVSIFPPLASLVFGAGLGLLFWGLVRAFRGGTSVLGIIGRVLGVLLAANVLWLAVRTLLAGGGRPGTAMVTLIYVLVGIAVQFTLGLGLAWLLTQGLPGQRFFRVVFLLPMMITPVGVAYMFRMLTDTSKGPLEPLWALVGLTDYSWVNDPW